MNTAIITGASSGIGLNISNVLLNLGYKVYDMGSIDDIEISQE